MGAKFFQKFGDKFKILGVKRVTWSRFRTGGREYCIWFSIIVLSQLCSHRNPLYYKFVFNDTAHFICQRVDRFVFPICCNVSEI